MPSKDELADTAAVPAKDERGQTTDSGLARTTTAGAADPKTPRTITALGRLKLERVLGSGGMGVVHAAFDPDLERRVAVKLLHASSADARARLLREARAMAKLSHPNVITVFDVGTADGEDFVTMELVDGMTLKDWLAGNRAGQPGAPSRPRWREIVAAFIAAGRGLAAAHDAGLVHRDFKPSNVLRSHNGKIVVTDFGLSRATTAEVDPMAITHGSSGGPSTRTQTGAVLGTPAYMAPEQWTGVTVGPASDQFAFCVALWEALAGRRPYHGDTFDELKTGVLAGPDSLPADAIPRPVRAILRRGLAPDPAVRWPTMHALLAALERALARRRRVLATAAALVVGAAGTTALLLTRPIASDCSPPALDPEAVWPAARADAIAKRDPESAKLLAGDLDAWRRTRVLACDAPAAQRSPELACLDGVLARIDVAARATETGEPGVEGTSSLLVDPALCTHAPPPHLATSIDPALADALAQLRAVRNGAKVGRRLLPDEPCARAIVLRARIASLVSNEDTGDFSTMMQDVTELEPLVDRCGDDALHAILAIGRANASLREVDRAATAVAAVPQDDLLAEIDLLHARQAGASDPATAIAGYERAAERFAHRDRPRGRIRALVELLDVLLSRSKTADVKRVGELVAKWRPTASKEDAKSLDLRAARARWRLGDVAGADALAHSLINLVSPPRPGIPRASGVAGIVVDEAGHPIGDAEVVASLGLDSDSTSAAAPLSLNYSVRTRAAHDGTFALADARGWIVASSGALRSTFVKVEPKVKIVVHPTSHVDGKVALGALDATQLRVVITTDSDVTYDAIAPVHADGTFSIDGVLRGKMTIAARDYNTESGDDARHIEITGDVRDLALTPVASGPLYIIARNAGVTVPDQAMVFVFAGPLPDPHLTFEKLKPRMRESAFLGAFEARVPRGASLPAIVRDRLQPDDFLAKMPTRQGGKTFACTIGLSNDMFAAMRTPDAMGKAFAGAELGCTEIASGDNTVVVEIPPIRRLRVP